MSLTKDKRDALPDTDFAVPAKRKLPIHDATHVRLAHDMVDRTQGLSDDERAHARRAILTRAKDLGVDTTSWTISAAVAFEAMAIEMPEVADHPNRMPFSGVLVRIDQTSDLPPGGAAKHCTWLPKAVAEAALPSLLGMAVDFKPDFDGHDARRKVGIITAATIEGDAVCIEGFLYAKDFPGECARIRAEKDALGFSFEADARIQDMDADLWVIDHCVFTGAAILYKDLAAYTTTSLSAHAAKDIDMTPEELKKLLADALAPLSATIEAQGKTISEIQAKGASLGGPIVDQVRPHVDALNACADAMEAAGVGNDAKTGHAGVIRRVAAHMAAAAVSGNVPKIYRDHDYLPDARVEAAAAAAAAAAAGAAGAADLTKVVTEAVAGVTAKIEALGTQVKDIQAKAFNEATPPARETLSPHLRTLLAKGNVLADIDAGKKLTVDQLDKTLEAAGIKGTQAIETKFKLQAAGLIDTTTP